MNIYTKQGLKKITSLGYSLVFLTTDQIIFRMHYDGDKSIPVEEAISAYNRLARFYQYEYDFFPESIW